ncbi:putative bifunctional diguanylate cyclase/phosphodiesterase [Novosphingobium album (ex Hu et al. 2023)]|uniref:EAL domain-containing protein n=1 Tax=Novosphingobium album (ex Hu et al. 2023) TaxID=2930093 RepID=A0ABT0B2Y7_9SPHN|nr:EAL domain-containing protein [Novosphingobium album (ex Hu et al. 2023)]MCJ2179408.1 EAL domain-containing protein [Novosphingobium album (ex Hu et al. 2023)]
MSVNAAILAYTHRNLAPGPLVLTVPAIMITVCMIRMLIWMRPVSARDLDVTQVENRLKRTVFLGTVLSVAYVCWAMMLDQYGGPYEHGHVAIFVAVTVLGCIFCLTFLPVAAFLVAVSVLGTFVVYCFVQKAEVMLAIALNISLVTAVVLKILRDYYNSFVSLEKSQRELQGERRQAHTLSEENARLAQTDSLTGIPNRRYFFRTLESLLERARPDETFTIGLIDLDRFKPVNDTHGHAHGDRLLQVIGQRMVHLCPDNAIVARLGGDEFGLIVMDGPEGAERVAQQMCRAIQEPVRIGDVLVSVGCSAGLAVYPETATSADLLFDRTDFALYHAKKQKRGQCVRFSEKLEHLIRSEQAIDAALHSADLTQELSLVYQPIVETETLKPLGVECLARWSSPTLGDISPELLIASAERAGRAREITLALFDTALSALQQLPASLRMSFNLSGHNLCDPDTITALLDRLAASDCDTGRLLFEITETSLITDIDTAEVALQRLRETGTRIALDDFGTGYSSLSSLHKLPLDIVKIDRSFAARLGDASGRRLITAIRNLVRSLSLDCVIEGIETEDQLISARLAGFTLAQGYFISRPMSLSCLLEHIEDRSTARWSAA